MKIKAFCFICAKMLVVGLAIMLNACSSTVVYSRHAEETTYAKKTLLKEGWQEMTVCFYGEDYHGRMTANGEIFDMYAMTAAHKTLDFGTKLLIWDEDNDKKVEVRINDRGPFVEGRDLDISWAAAKKIDLISSGVKKLKVRIEK